MTNSKDRITSTANPRIKELCKLKPSKDLFLVEGKHLVDMAFERGSLKEVFCLEPVSYPGVKMTLVSPEVLQKLAFSPSPSGIIGLAYKKEEAPSSPEKVLILDRVQDPGNVGTLLRSALSFGYHKVYLLAGTASPYSHKVIASSQGALFRLDIVETPDGPRLIQRLKEEGYYVLGSALKNAIPLKQLKREKGKLALILGNEGQGISEELLALSHNNVKIEMEEMESLNVGVAGGILMYCL